MMQIVKKNTMKIIWNFFSIRWSIDTSLAHTPKEISNREKVKSMYLGEIKTIGAIAPPYPNYLLLPMSY